MREIKVFAPAKLNLYLDVLDKRDDGYHNIETVFEKIDLLDEIVIRENPRTLHVKSDSPVCPSGRENIVYKALEILSKELSCPFNLDIEIKKRIPIAAGLGGGSSDAASALRAVNKIFELGLSQERLLSIASKVGKDVPFFMLDSSFAIGRGAGEILENIETDLTLSHVLVKPKRSIKTAWMYQRIDAYKKENKKTSRLGSKNIVRALKNRDIGQLKKNFYNVFEGVLNGYDGHIKKVEDILLKSAVDGCNLTGSGPTFFCTLEDREEAMRVLAEIPKDRDMEIFLVNTYKGDIL